MQIRENRRKNDVDSRIDYGIIFSVMMLALIGIMSIYVATVQDSQNPLKNVASQIVWYVIGAVVIAVIMQFDAEQLWQVANYAYYAGLALLFLVLIFYSRSYAANTGAKSWFAIGSFTFQPSEVMKPAFILMLGKVITNHNSEYRSHTIRTDFLLIGKMLLYTLPIMVLLKLQNDFGTILVFVAILGGMILVSGIDWRILLPAFLIVAVVGGTALLFATTDWGRQILGNFGFRSYQFARIDSWLDPSADTSENGYQIWQNMKAIGSGQLFGKGFNVSNVYVPVRESDMIFSVIGENFGFVGSCVLILLYFLLIYQMVQVTFDTKNEFYAYVSTGVIMMILFHVFENIGMSVGLLPLTGIPLPFVSQGGSALLGNMIGIGLIMSMRFHHKSYMFENGTFGQGR
ncbi:FtsW/RodA/SpoVE family cell cycle protein [Companilactobacillus halodurans]|uniref:Rod shape-determining protein RodA n=1 Tax=Companilactobacillus halodurans TaxID=2584183 RepID=A0A5P0ZY05_9LACO|nr:FtsW/RodA/SpoVE family cell cycle protein [Companilactobacillus halodurans]MQS74976.1 rod shape-determining protein RodA [Companilactobacillus halodurans]MQS97900.1 rod shape-determining protein RodA [Companilactobacillus halodurans]